MKMFFFWKRLLVKRKIISPVIVESVVPISRKFGFDRGLPIDRYYIEEFLSENKKFIKGDVLEVGDRLYTKKFGGRRVRKSLVLNYRRGWGVNYVADLGTGEGVPENVADCFIMTQTLPFIFNFQEALKNALKTLRKGGILLLTTGGVTQISRYDMKRWGHFWSFTDLSLRTIVNKLVPMENIEIKTYGNVKSACAFLYGLASEELTKEDLEYHDPDYQVIIAAKVIK